MIERLRRVLRCLQVRFPNKRRLRTLELERAIMTFCGTDRRTVLANKKALVKLGWIKLNYHHILLPKEFAGDVVASDRPPPIERPKQEDDDFVGRGDDVVLKPTPVRHNVPKADEREGVCVCNAGTGARTCTAIYHNL